MSEIPKTRITLILGLAIGMTLLAEVFYFIVWGVVLFPGGSLFNKAIWTMTCGIGMGAVIGTIVLVLVEGKENGQSAILQAALAMFAVGTYCALLCSHIDASLNYFGGAENTMLFVAAGLIPAAAGGILFGWLLYGAAQSTRI